ncbi:MAG: DNA gyrase inhibitor YacG [Ancalomicrobiaceae bacterium]|nr:DNA gyrase inhibitor YacG [Ancalomicrobiaceae bacterium]
MSAMIEDTETKDSRTPRPCPTCGKLAVGPTYPFCSKRCRLVDLNRWLNGSYAIPVVEDDGGDGDG